MSNEKYKQVSPRYEFVGQPLVKVTQEKDNLSPVTQKSLKILKRSAVDQDTVSRVEKQYLSNKRKRLAS